MDAIWCAESRVAAMVDVESAVACAQGEAGDIPKAAAPAIVAAAARTGRRDLGDGWGRARPCCRCSTRCGRVSTEAPAPPPRAHDPGRRRHRDDELGGGVAELRPPAPKRGRAPSGHRSLRHDPHPGPVVPAAGERTTFGFRVERWMAQLDALALCYPSLPGADRRPHRRSGRHQRGGGAMPPTSGSSSTRRRARGTPTALRSSTSSRRRCVSRSGPRRWRRHRDTERVRRGEDPRRRIERRGRQAEPDRRDARDGGGRSVCRRSRRSSSPGSPTSSNGASAPGTPSGSRSRWSS